jgi:uncharacterized repeat protein (TIGR03803 family)
MADRRTQKGRENMFVKRSCALSSLLLLGASLVGLCTPAHATDVSPPYFGSSYSGGTNGSGFVFEVTHLGNFGSSDMTIIYSFCSAVNCHDGGNPSGNIIQLADGSLIGTTSSGGQGQAGTIFKLTPSSSGNWSETTLYAFCPYFGDCTHYGYANGTLSLIGPTLLLGTLSDGPNGRGMMYTFDFGGGGAFTSYDTWHQ